MSDDWPNDPEVHDEHEVEQAAEALDAAALKRLRATARALLRNLGLDPRDRDHDDLLGEALSRTLNGSRSWRKGIDFLYHLTQTMSSVAWQWRGRTEESKRKDPISSAGDDRLASDLDAFEHLVNTPVPGPDIETEFLIRERLAAVERLFADDPAASEVIACWGLGYKGPEIQRKTGMTKKEFQTTVRRIRRTAQREGPP